MHTAEGSSDFEVWSPHSGKKDCVLGRSVSYTRRKQRAACFVNEAHDRITTRSNCECTMDDFECDSGFKRSKDGVTCVVQPSADAADDAEQTKAEFEADMLKLGRDPEALLEDMCIKYSDKSELHTVTGYRRIPGDTCIDGIKFTPSTLDCGRKSISVGSGGAVLFGLMAIVVAVGAAIYFEKCDAIKQIFAKRTQVGSVKYSVLDETGLEAPESIFEETEEQ